MKKRFMCAAVALVMILMLIAGAQAQSLAADQQLNAYYTLMTLALTNAEYSSALEYAQACMEMESLMDDTLRADIRLKQGYALMYLERYDEAIEALDACLEILPDTAEAILLKMQALVLMGQTEAATAEAEAYAAAYPEQTAVYMTLGELFALSGDYENAVNAYAAYIESDGANATAYKMRGQYLLQLGRYDEAEADLTQAIQLFGDTADARAHYLRAIVRLQTGKNVEAIEDLDECVAYLDSYEGDAEQIDADVRNSRYYRGIAAMQIGQYDQAVEDFTRCVEDGISQDYARFWRGACYLDSGEYEKAKEDFVHSSAQGVETASCMYYTALCDMGLEQYEAAVEGFTDCIEQDVMSAQAMYNRGMCYIQMGETQKGQADLEQSLAQGGETDATIEPEIPQGIAEGTAEP